MVSEGQPSSTEAAKGGGKRLSSEKHSVASCGRFLGWFKSCVGCGNYFTVKRAWVSGFGGCRKIETGWHTSFVVTGVPLLEVFKQITKHSDMMCNARMMCRVLTGGEQAAGTAAERHSDTKVKSANGSSVESRKLTIRLLRRTAAA